MNENFCFLVAVEAVVQCEVIPVYWPKFFKRFRNPMFSVERFCIHPLENFKKKLTCYTAKCWFYRPDPGAPKTFSGSDLVQSVQWPADFHLRPGKTSKSCRSSDRSFLSPRRWRSILKRFTEQLTKKHFISFYFTVKIQNIPNNCHPAKKVPQHRRHHGVASTNRLQMTSGMGSEVLLNLSLKQLCPPKSSKWRKKQRKNNFPGKQNCVNVAALVLVQHLLTHSPDNATKIAQIRNLRKNQWNIAKKIFNGTRTQFIQPRN